MKEQGQEFNPETNCDLRDVPFSFEAHGIVFRFQLQVPEYIRQRVTADSANRARIQDYMEGYSRGVVEDAMRRGYLHTDEGQRIMRRDVGTHLKNYLWERFSVAQEAAGNQCWQTSETLQQVLR